MKKLLLTLLGCFILSTVSALAESVEVTSFSSTDGNLDANISYATAKNDGTVAPVAKKNQIYLYQPGPGKTDGGSITISAANGYTMTEVVIGSGMATNVAYTVDDGDIVANNEISLNGKLTVGSINAGSIKFICRGSSKSKRFYVNYIKVTYQSESGLKSAGLKFEPENGVAYLDNPDAFAQPAFTKVTTAAVTFASDKPEIATVDASTGEITPVAAGTATITATSAANDEYDGGSATYELVVKATTPSACKLQTSNDNLRDGLEFYIASTSNNVVMSTTQNSNNRGKVDVTFSDGIYAPGTEDSQLVTLEDAGNSMWYLKVGEAGYLYAASSSSNYLRTTATKNDNCKATIEIASTGEAEITFQGTYTHKLMQYNSSSKIFSCYIGAQVAIQIYADENSGTIVDPNKQPAGLSFGETTDFVIAEGAEFTKPELTNPNNLEVAYASDNEAVATVDATTGAVTIVGTGTATITATSEENETYNAGSASYTITVKTAANTLAEYLEKAAANGATAIINCKLVVTYANGANVYVTDEQRTAYSLIYKYNLGYNKGDVIPAGWNAKTTIYNGLFEIIPDGDMPAATETVDVEYETVTEFGVADINKLVILNDVTLTSATAGTAPAGQEFTLYNNFKLSGVPTSGKFNIIGVIGYYEKGVTSTENLKVEKLQLQPVEYQIHQDNVGKVFFSQNIAAENDQRWELFEEDSYTSSDNAIYVKFEAGEGHKVYFRYKDINGNVVAPILVDEPAETTEPAEQTAALANETATADEEGFTEYTKPARFEVAGSLEHYTVHTESGVKTAVKTITASGVTGIEDIVADGDEADAVYYNLQGVRVDNPENGLYIRVRGNKVEKVVK